jgi:hypothetical protein
MRLARPKIVGGVLVMKAGAAKLLAEPGYADADGCEDRSWTISGPVRFRRRRKFPRSD